MKAALEPGTEAKWRPSCCGSRIDHETCIENIPEDMRRKYRRKQQEYSTPIDHRYYCPVLDCGLFMDKSRQPLPRATCPSGHVTCVKCLQDAHDEADEQCAESSNADPLSRMARDVGWTRCYRCKIFVDHSSGCRHMLCLCGAQFCFACGLQWPTCACTAADLYNVKKHAKDNADRRQAQEERNREINQEHQRFLEAEETEATPESSRRKGVRRKYKDLESTLDKLGDLQKHLQDEVNHRASADLESAREKALSRARQRSKIETSRSHRAVGPKMRVVRMSMFGRNWEESLDGKSFQKSRVEEIGSTEGRDLGEKLPETGIAIHKRRTNTDLTTENRQPKPLRTRSQEEGEDIGGKPQSATEEDIEKSFTGQRQELERKIETENYWLGLILPHRYRLLKDRKRAELDNRLEVEPDARLSAFLTEKAAMPTSSLPKPWDEPGSTSRSQPDAVSVSTHGQEPISSANADCFCKEDAMRHEGDVWTDDG